MTKEQMLESNGILLKRLKEEKPMLLHSILKTMDEYAGQQVKLFAIHNVSNNEERVAVSCTSCKWRQAKFEYKCDNCIKFNKWEQDTDC